MRTEIAALQREIWNGYAAALDLQTPAHYFGGARLRPVVPLDVGLDGVFILGAYPSARFEVVGSESDVPVADNLGPFEPERYFDGSRVRTLLSADELQQHYLTPLGLTRETCWVTDLVKVFLFKDGHRAKYRRLDQPVPIGYERERFEELGRRSLPWIERELDVANPRLMVTLGAEVAGIVRGVDGDARRNALLDGRVTSCAIGQRTVATVHLAHPGILMRAGDPRNPWPDRHANEHVPALRRWLSHE